MSQNKSEVEFKLAPVVLFIKDDNRLANDEVLIIDMAVEKLPCDELPT
jgi:hypothetical protein